MRILVSIPGISFKDTIDNSSLFKNFVQEPIPFSPSTHNLDSFSCLGENIPLKLFGINIPHLILTGNAIGVAGPGYPKDELFVPPSLKEKLISVCGVYDKWRPYPAQAVTNYTFSMAHKFAKKRGKIFSFASNNASWEVLFYVEHAPSSLIHLDRKAALTIAETTIHHAVQAIIDWPGVSVVLFSPYGYQCEDGFICSNCIDCHGLDNWNKLKGGYWDDSKT